MKYRVVRPATLTGALWQSLSRVSVNEADPAKIAGRRVMRQGRPLLMTRSGQPAGYMDFGPLARAAQVIKPGQGFGFVYVPVRQIGSHLFYLIPVHY
jgi:hypothetical protein